MRWLVTGAAGFIGTNLVTHLLQTGEEVVALDDFSRDGVRSNADFLQQTFDLKIEEVDITDERRLASALDAFQQVDAIAHLAGQVSLLASIADPVRDFEVNARGTLNLLEWIRTKSPATAIISMSSNKVYGDLADVRIEELPTRYSAPDFPLGFDEETRLDFHGPYGCSKGASDQYVADYARIYGLRAASLRQSSVYGPFQHPRSDQGWVAHLVAESLAGRTIRLNGIGKQVRDLLHAEDLARLFVALEKSLEPGHGHQLNVGGGPNQTLSLLELFAWLESESDIVADFEVGPERPSDQKVYVSDIRKVMTLTGWEPQITVVEGLTRLVNSQHS